MQVRNAMSDDVQIASPNQSLGDAAILMAKIDAGGEALCSISEPGGAHSRLATRPKSPLSRLFVKRAAEMKRAA